MKRGGKLHGLCATARLANIPSVACNVWLGVAVSQAVHAGASGGELAIPWRATGQLMAAGVLLYVAGNFLNDWMDRDWDARHRPERALPRGLFRPEIYRIVALAAAAAGVSLASVTADSAGWVALCIVAAIYVYTIWHKRRVWTVVPMGLCRALLPVMGAAGTGGAAFLANGATPAAAAALFGYIVGLSLAARGEASPGPAVTARGRGWWWFGLPPVMAAAGWLVTGGLPGWFWLGLLPYAGWLWRCETTRRSGSFRFVGVMLAGIPWVDGLFLLPLAAGELARGHGATPFGLACLMIPVLAVGKGLALQRLAPAT